MPLEPVLHPYPDLAAASQAMAAWAAETVRRRLGEGQAGAIALPGGSTPGLFLSAFARQPLPWPRLTLLPTDERFVPADHPRSNEGMMRAALAPALAAGAAWLSFARSDSVPTPEALASGLDARVSGLLPLTLVICGMGEDGHVASLFPGDPQSRLPTGSGPAVVAVHPAGLEPRISLSAGVLRDSTEAGLLFAGATKQAVFAEALRLRDKPVTLLLAENRGLHVFSAGQS